MTKMPEWEKHMETCFQPHCPVFTVALEIAMEALALIHSRKDHRTDFSLSGDALRRISELGQ